MSRKSNKVSSTRSDQVTNDISSDDIAAKFSELKDELEFASGAARGVASKVGLLAGIAAVVVAFLLGSRRGKRNKTVVEVRRF